MNAAVVGALGAGRRLTAPGVVGQELIRKGQQHSMKSDDAKVPPYILPGHPGKTYVPEGESELISVCLCYRQVKLKAKVLYLFFKFGASAV